MAKIYTRSGDAGETALYGGGRVGKDDVRVEAMGSIDELNAALGVVRTELARSVTVPGKVDSLLGEIQHRLFNLGAELATPNPTDRGNNLVNDTHVTGLESVIDQFDGQLEPLREFILPGGVPAAAQLHLARCVCRRAERRLVELMRREPIRGEPLRFLNRLSDLMFILARGVNRANGTPDVTWQRGETGGFERL